MSLKPGENPEFIQTVVDTVRRGSSWDEVFATIVQKKLPNSAGNSFHDQDGMVVYRIVLKNAGGMLPTGRIPYVHAIAAI